MNKHTNQWNKIENPEIYPNISGDLVCDEVGITDWYAKDGLFGHWHWTYRSMEQNREFRDKPIHICGQLIFDMDTMTLNLNFTAS